VSDAEIKADKLMEKLMIGKEIHDIFSEKMRENLLIGGYTMEYWEDYFRLPVHSNMTTSVCKELASKLMELNQEAAFFHAAASAKLQVIKRGGESAYRDKLFALVEEYKQKNEKRPAASMLENLAKLESDDIESAYSVAEIEKTFWSNILDYLSTCRKLVENATFNSSIEAKMQQAGR
jgi:hypothetical protein